MHASGAARELTGRPRRTGSLAVADSGRTDSARLIAFAGGLFLLCYFLSFTWRGLFVYFVPDDMMNLYWAYTEPPLRLLATLFVPFTNAYRPTGAAVYRGVYELAGFHPFAFRLVTYFFLILNIWLLYVTVKRLSSSRYTGLLAALLGAYHHRLLDLYDENGTVYDVLCYTFFLLAILAYARLRESAALRRWVMFYLAFTAALNAKEMAVMLPVVLLAYEWLYCRRLISAPLVVSLVMAAAALAAKIGPGSRLTGNPAYSRELTAARFFENWRFFLSDIFYLPTETIADWGVVLILVAIVALALISGRRDLRLFAVWILFTPLPVLLIPRRSFFVMYLPLVGWCGYFAVLISGALHWGARVLPEPRDPSPRARAMVFLAVALVLAPLHAYDRWAVWSEDREIQKFRDAMVAVAPSLPRDSRLLFLDDPFHPENWIPTQILPLVYDDQKMAVDRVKRMPHPPSPQELEKYTAVFDWRDGRAIRVR